ncbi:MAG: phosphoribosylformylglycinamidine synthase [Nitrospirae bacterium CG18_big_fil_WC_8_21_14_2_50_70_55]|nr:phosphoribosylformylglycinamidine synthase subunit PurS [Deltaproteobacteria bacterium]OIP64725.1 MAG: phosphoribosylformylglycinamidine synthase [Nitrospirae bacterium CG2_30_70_394]PIQ03860.1 MAG: phosphoribosylformylglycinamidine synthase [Nitrospirae bacterium CG18_big_fil_WC_8_21_14_2_50_70_55]PIU79867.1 MAG: phosphoribosylformylglycinamidine synthase [Nitrospirae bacterium CG06_land_8_20_14_3_00_70_43]PIW82530.1 MAG: phosphoribosylformylglycinamidine synthase [Nitrospirae bacterium CG_
MAKAKIHITLKQGVLDPQGKAVRHALDSLGFTGVTQVRIGKLIEIDLAGGDRAAQEAQVRDMCERLLANTVIEEYTFEIA